jgi:hypothetical protein
MARIRTIKPEFFTSEDIVELSPLARLLYVGLWCEADREGRMVWKPKTFKIRYLPADDCDIVTLCAELVDSRLVELYGDGYAYIPAFLSHQHVNPRETQSTLPEPMRKAKNGTRSPRVIHASPSRDKPSMDATSTHREEGKGREGNEEEHELPNGNSSPSADAEGPPTRSDPIPYQAIVDVFNRTLTRLPKVREITPKRRTLIRSAWQAAPERRSLDFWEALAAEYESNDFTNGTGPYLNGHENWRPDFDYLMRAGVVTRTFERAMDRLERGSP